MQTQEFLQHLGYFLVEAIVLGADALTWQDNFHWDMHQFQQIQSAWGRYDFSASLTKVGRPGKHKVDIQCTTSPF
jgi:hypothetical protein